MTSPEEDRNLEHKAQVLLCIARVCKMTPERVLGAIEGMKRDGLSWRQMLGVFQEIARAHGNRLDTHDDLVQTTGRAAFYFEKGNPS